MNGISCILFFAIFLATTTINVLQACNSRDTEHMPDPRTLSPLEMEGFKHMFLSKLGMTRPPTRQEVANASEYFPRHFDTRHPEAPSTGHLGRDTTFRDVISFTGKANMLEIQPQDSNEDSMFIEITFDNFTIPSILKHSRTLSAKLKLFFSHIDLTPSATALRERSVVKIYQIIDNQGKEERELIDSRSVPLGEPMWRTFDVTEAVQSWQSQDDGGSKRKLFIHLDTAELYQALLLSTTNKVVLNSNKRHLTTESLQLQNHLRLDVTFLNDTKHKPQRRMRRTQPRYSSGTDCIQSETTCCREERTVSFADLGWDYWVVSPDHFTLYHCKGSCPQGHRMANNYATIKSQLHVVNPSQWDPPCCSASSLGDLTIQHLTPKGYEEAVMEDIIVEECMCV